MALFYRLVLKIMQADEQNNLKECINIYDIILLKIIEQTKTKVCKR